MSENYNRPSWCASLSRSKCWLDEYSVSSPWSFNTKESQLHIDLKSRTENDSRSCCCNALRYQALCSKPAMLVCVVGSVKECRTTAISHILNCETSPPSLNCWQTTAIRLPHLSGRQQKHMPQRWHHKQTRWQDLVSSGDEWQLGSLSRINQHGNSCWSNCLFSR